MRKRSALRAPAALLMAALFTLVLTAELVDRVVAVVGNEVITERELDQAYQSDALGLMRPDPVTHAPAPAISKPDYLDKMIEQMVIAQEVKKQGINVDVLEVEKAVDRKRESLGLTEEEFERALAMQGITMDQYREDVKNQLVTYRLISQEVRGEIEISDERVRAYYDQHPEQFTQKDSYHLRHIFIPFPADGTTAERQQAVDSLEEIRAKVLAGADFAEQAREFSRSPTASQGGDLGWFSIDELLPEFKEQVKGLKAGEMTPVFVHGNGAHLVLVQEIKGGQLMPFDQVSSKIKDKLYQQETMQRYGLWLERLKAKTHIENRLKDQQTPSLAP